LVEGVCGNKTTGARSKCKLGIQNRLWLGGAKARGGPVC
jgi:hypothetical protein